MEKDTLPVHLVEAALSGLKASSSATGDDYSNMALVSLASFVREQEKSEKKQSLYHLEMFVRCLKDISSTSHSNCTLVYHQFVNSIEVSKLV